MTKSNHFDSVFYVTQPQKLSTSVSSNIAGTYSTDSILNFVLFERDSRKVSSLANGIVSTYSDKTNSGGIQESMTKKARGLIFMLAYLCLRRPRVGTSAEQPRLAERRV